MSEQSLQEQYAPETTCFGCGPRNGKGLRIGSFPSGGAPDWQVVATWQAEDHHQAFRGAINGGIIGTLLDCHSNWAAMWHLMQRDGLDKPPPTVTAQFHVKLRRPTPHDEPVRILAHATSSEGNRVEVESRIESAGEVTATCTGTFVAVGPGHPSYDRW